MSVPLGSEVLVIWTTDGLDIETREAQEVEGFPRGKGLPPGAQILLRRSGDRLHMRIFAQREPRPSTPSHPKGVIRRVLIDGDSLSKLMVGQLDAICRRVEQPFWLYTNRDGVRMSFATVVIVGRHPEAADSEILLDAQAGDLVVTHDRALAEYLHHRQIWVIDWRGRDYEIWREVSTGIVDMAATSVEFIDRLRRLLAFGDDPEVDRAREAIGEVDDRRRAKKKSKRKKRKRMDPLKARPFAGLGFFTWEK